MASRRIQAPLITIRGLSGGFAPDHGSSLTMSSKGSGRQYATASAIDFFRDRFIGDMAPGFDFTNLTDASTRVNALPLEMLVLSNGEAFCGLENSARIVQFGTGDNTVDANNDITAAAPNHAGHTAVKFQSILQYQDGSGEYFLYSWRDNNDWEIGRYTVGSGYDDDFFSTTITLSNNSGDSALSATEQYPGMLWQSPDGLICRTNGRWIMQFDPTGTAANLAALNLGLGWISFDGVPFQDYSAIAAYRSSTASSVGASGVRVILWDGYSPEPTAIHEIPDINLLGIRNDEGVLRVFTYGKDNMRRAWRFIGDRFVLEYQTAKHNFFYQPRGADTYLNGVLMGSNQGIVYGLYGLGQGKAAMHAPMKPTGNTTSLVKSLGATLYVGFSSGSDYRLARISTGYVTSASLTTQVYELPARARVTRFRFYFSQFGTNASLHAAFYKGQSQTTDLLDFTMTRSALGAIDYFPLERHIDDVKDFHMKFTFNHAAVTDTAAILQRVEVEYELPGYPP